MRWFSSRTTMWNTNNKLVLMNPQQSSDKLTCSHTLIHTTTTCCPNQNHTNIKPTIPFIHLQHNTTYLLRTCLYKALMQLRTTESE